jgi:hypothetical protein
MAEVSWHSGKETRRLPAQREALFNREAGHSARHSSASWRRFSTAKLVIQFLP